MHVFVLQSDYFGLFEVWATYEACKAHAELNPDITVRPGEGGGCLYVEGRHSPVGHIRLYPVKS